MLFKIIYRGFTFKVWSISDNHPIFFLNISIYFNRFVTAIQGIVAILFAARYPILPT